MSAAGYYIAEEELRTYIAESSADDFPARLAAFVRQQCATWPELQQARRLLGRAAVKILSLSDLEVTVQHNPERIRSSASAVDGASVARRPCFLCPRNLYPRQKALRYRQEWLLLNNPFPIFEDHLVVAHQEHRPQAVGQALEAMLAVVADSGRRILAFYNGPACGASAPDHLHFQACPAAGIPLPQQVAGLVRNGSPCLRLIDRQAGSASCLGAVDNRGMFVCLTDSAGQLQRRLASVLAFLQARSELSSEPPVNLLIAGLDAGYIGILLPRRAHRPACFFQAGSAQMIISPGAVDVGGLIIMPRQQDFARVDPQRLLQIFAEVCCGPEVFAGLAL